MGTFSVQSFLYDFFQSRNRRRISVVAGHYGLFRLEILDVLYTASVCVKN